MALVVASSSNAHRTRPDFDAWSKRCVAFEKIEDMRTFLKTPGLLNPFFERTKELLDLLTCNPATERLYSGLAEDMVRSKVVTVLVYGETGAGKSALCRAITGAQTSSASKLRSHAGRRETCFRVQARRSKSAPPYQAP